jgi:hypothetical protein
MHELEAQPVSKRVKKILYSDKSESSFDENMEDTPSNYNIPNGRLDGRSRGLKSLLNLERKKNRQAALIAKKQHGLKQLEETGTIQVPNGSKIKHKTAERNLN